MTNKEILKHYNRLKEVYDTSSITTVFNNHIADVFLDVQWDMTKNPVMMYADGKPVKVMPVDKFYPKYLEYTESDVKSFNLSSEIIVYGIDARTKYYIRMELLRKIFLFTLENFVSKHNYGIEFAAIHSVPINSIPFSLQYTGSGKVYRRFVDGN